MIAPCPRKGCENFLTDVWQVVCTGDFTMLAGMCCGKKRFGQPQADWIASCNDVVAYPCPVCREFHTGQPIRDRATHMHVAREAVQALQDDPRVGRGGVAELAGLWSPENGANRARWHEGLDQRVLLHLHSS